MKTVLITGGTDGIGRGIALSCLQKGCQVIAVGSSAEKGQRLMAEADSLGKGAQLTFLQADLSLVSENRRIIKQVSNQVPNLDALVLCAASLCPQKAYSETKEGHEFTFSLYYLSRYVLCFGLKELLEKSSNPLILNVCAPGMKGKVHWNDIQMKEKYDGQSAQFHGSRLNDLLGVSFTEKDSVKKIHYLLFNPMAARTPGAAKMGEGNPLMKAMMKLYYRLAGKDVEEIVALHETLIHKLPASDSNGSGLYAYKLEQPVDLRMGTFEKEDARRLDEITAGMLHQI